MKKVEEGEHSKLLCLLFQSCWNWKPLGDAVGAGGVGWWPVGSGGECVPGAKGGFRKEGGNGAAITERRKLVLGL